jgi:hypothetical protein
VTTIENAVALVSASFWRKTLLDKAVGLEELGREVPTFVLTMD